MSEIGLEGSKVVKSGRKDKNGESGEMSIGKRR